MQYNQQVLTLKEKYLDIIFQKDELLHMVLKRNLGAGYSIENIPRSWSPAGGATLFKINSNGRLLFLKVKHKSVLIESKLEDEEFFSTKSSLQNEYEILQILKEEVFIPKVIFFDEEEDIQFLATEYIKNSFLQCLKNASLEDSLACWNNLYAYTKKLFNMGLVHSDLHEYNIRCFDNITSIVLVDFEESRFFAQQGEFESSLDYKGMYNKSILGECNYSKKQDLKIHIACLLHIKEILKNSVAEKTIKYIESCNYDSSNGICMSISHGKSKETYQSVINEYIHIVGQRNELDIRVSFLKELYKILFTKGDTFIDVGSNNGLFCREISKISNDKIRCIGLEGFAKFNILARSLAFLEECKKIEYYDFYCGEDVLDFINHDEVCFLSICSVWHHIQKKFEFLNQLKQLNIEYIFWEMATQNECYNGNTWQSEIEYIQKTLGFKYYIVLGYSTDYNRPLILMARNEIKKVDIKAIHKAIKKVVRTQKMHIILQRIRKYFIKLLNSDNGIA